MAAISTTTPLAANGVFISNVVQTTRATNITGTVFADQPGTLTVSQSGDGTHFDIETDAPITANVGEAIDIELFEQWFQVSYVNGSTDQGVFRLYIDLRDPYGAFLEASQGPMPGGAWVVLYFNDTASHYEIVGRFDGTDSWNANQNAALFKNQSGKYASVPAANFVATVETIEQTTEHSPISF